MKFIVKKIYIVFFLYILLFLKSVALAKDNKILYTRENISNYFLGSISLNQGFDRQAFKYLKKVQQLKDKHYKFNIEFIRTLILLEKFDQAFAFSKSVWKEDEFFFEADLILGLEQFIKKDYAKAEKHFQRLNKISRYNLFFDDFIGNILIAWSRASQNKKNESFKSIKKIKNPYSHLKKIQEGFLQCYFELDTTQKSFEEIIKNEDYNFSRYHFFLANYFLSKNKITEAKNTIEIGMKESSSNLLLKQSEDFLIKGEINKMMTFYDCKNPKDSIAEFFYVIANLYASEKNYQLSNFYLKISLFLNKKFLTNKLLLAENYYYQKKYNKSKNAYLTSKSIGEVYSWYASKSIASILLEEQGKKHSIESLEKEFKLLLKPNLYHYYDLANFYKDSEYYKKSIEYYSLALNKITKDHFLYPKILDRRGTSYERLGDWAKAEKDLLLSLEIKPDQPHVLNYLAYSWVDKGINLDKGLAMLKKAAELKENDGYIIDSLGWAYYAKKNYDLAEFFLQRALELLPSDPIINDHYADTLWMLNKDIQARYFWKNILNLSDTEQELKDNVSKKLIFGINKEL